MKKPLIALLIFCMILPMAACGSNEAQAQSPAESTSPIAPSSELSEDVSPSASSDTLAPAPNPSALVVYFSMPETTDPDNMTEEEENSTFVVDGEVLGNTQFVAYVIQERLGADIFRIEPEVPYPTDHTTLVDMASEEQEENARPKLKETVDNLDDYSTVFIGYPNWWGDMPMILYTFLEQHDLSGKTIIPFNTHGGSGFSGTIQTIATLQPGATVAPNGFTISRNQMEQAESEALAWLADLGY